MARPRKKKEAPKSKKRKRSPAPAPKPTRKPTPKRRVQQPKKAVQRPKRAPERAPRKVAKKVEKPTKAPQKVVPPPKGWVQKFIEKATTTPAQKAVAKRSLKPRKVEKPTKETKQLEAEVKKLRAADTKRKKELKRTKADLAKTKAGLKKLEAQEARKAERKKKRKERAPAETDERSFDAKIGRTTHIWATEVDGEPQYIWKELEEKAAPYLVRTKKGEVRRWARLVVELAKEALLRPEQYRRLRGKAVLRTNWHPAHELIGKAAEVMDKLQKSGAVVLRAKIVIVESDKKPPGRVF